MIERTYFIRLEIHHLLAYDAPAVTLVAELVTRKTWLPKQHEVVADFIDRQRDFYGPDCTMNLLTFRRV